jgi:hypothetical protein
MTESESRWWSCSHVYHSYSGKSNYGLTLKWRELSESTYGAETLLNLIWTDLVSFTVVGTKTGFEDDSSSLSSLLNQQTSSLGTRPVHRYIRVIEYGDIRYAIPAFIAGGLFLIPLVVSLAMLCFQRHSWRALNHYMNQTNMGRAMTQAILSNQPDEISYDARTTEWARRARYIILPVPDVGEKGPRDGRSHVQSEDAGMARVATLDEQAISESLREYYARKPGGYAAVANDIPEERVENPHDRQSRSTRSAD